MGYQVSRCEACYARDEARDEARDGARDGARDDARDVASNGASNAGQATAPSGRPVYVGPRLYDFDGSSELRTST